MKSYATRKALLCAVLTLLTCAADAEAKPISVAVLNFDVSSPELKVKGADVAILIATQLSSNPDLLLADRVEIDKALGEQAMGISGTVDVSTAAKIGKLTGVQILVSGRVFQSMNETLFVSKIMSTENGRVYGEMVSLPQDSSMAKAVVELSTKIDATLSSKRSTLVVEPEKSEDLLAKLKQLVANKKLPNLTIRIPEIRLGATSIEPAAEGEFQKVLGQLGFILLDSKIATSTPDIEVKGDAVSQISFRKGELVSARANVSAKAIDRLTGRVIWSDSESKVAVDISDEIASRMALQNASRTLLERFVTQVTSGAENKAN